MILIGHDNIAAIKINIALMFGIFSEIKNSKPLISVKRDIKKQIKNAN